MEIRQPIILGEKCYLDVENEILVKDNLPIALSRIQFRLLYYLAQHLGQPVSDQELANYAWGTEAFISKSALYVNINRLRQRLEDNPKMPKCLMSLRGSGYVLYPRRINNR